MQSRPSSECIPGAPFLSKRRSASNPTEHLQILAGIVLLLSAIASASAAQPISAPQVDAAVPVKSVFVDDPKVGKDPFFPHSKRHIVETVSTNAPVQVMPDLVLGGISGYKDKRLAVINNRTLEIGEELGIRFNNQLVKVRCVEIREKSVVVSVDGQTKEIFLRNNL